jgi:hypothetical protein
MNDGFLADLYGSCAVWCVLSLENCDLRWSWMSILFSLFSDISHA